jgi:hypothetical protein
VTVNGDSFVLVGHRILRTQLFELTSDSAGRVYAGNNSNDSLEFRSGCSIPRFSPNTAGPAELRPGARRRGRHRIRQRIYLRRELRGVERITVPGGVGTLFMPGVASNGTGSPIVVVRPMATFSSAWRIDRNQPHRRVQRGRHIRCQSSHRTDVETMTFDAGSGLIYYAPFGPQVRALNPLTNADVAVAHSSGTSMAA